MDAALDGACTLGARTVWLSVWTRNPRAVAFYQKCGFAKAGTGVFVLGRDEQTDYIMVRALAPATVTDPPV